MAATAKSYPGGPQEMPPRSSMPSDDKYEILRAIGGVDATVAGLRSDISYMREKVDELGRKVDGVDKEKAARSELAAAEARLERALLDYKIQAKMDLDRVAKFKVDVADLAPGTIDSLLERVGQAESQVEENKQVIQSWKDKAQGGWVVFAKIGAVLSALIASAAFMIHELLDLAKVR